MATLDVATFEQIATILSQLSTNYSNLFADYYNLFYNPTPMDVTIELYDDAGNLTTITIPNRAKDRTYILNGNGDPEGVVEGAKGSVYQDLQNGTVYVKEFANTDNEGWSKLMTLDSLGDYLIVASGNPEGEVVAGRGVLYVDKGNAALYIKSTPTGNTGWVLISASTSELANVDLSNLSVTGKAYFANPSLTNLDPTAAAWKDSRQSVENLTTTLNSSSTDIQYPSAKATYDKIVDATEPLANRDLNNLTQTGEDHFVGINTQVRDCILKAPNGLPFITSNIITLKAGTVLLCANGINSGKALSNIIVTTSTDISISDGYTSTDGITSATVFYNNTLDSLVYVKDEEYFRQTFAPSGFAKMMWYNPDTNVYKYTSNSGSTWNEYVIAEIAKFTTNSTGGIATFSPYYPLVVATQEDIKNLKNFAVRSIGEIVASTVPVSDASLHLLDGSLVSSGVYGEFVQYMVRLYTSYPELFVTQAEWDESVETYGICEKYVYDSENETIRLPKYDNNEHGFLLESNVDGTSWYRIYSDGWCEQGGSFNNGGNGGVTVPLIKIYLNTNYTVSLQSTGGLIGQGYVNSNTVYSKAVGSFYQAADYGESRVLMWRACGYTDVSAYQGSSKYKYVVVATSAKTNIQINIDQIATDLNNKADIDLANTTPAQSFIDNTLLWGLPDYSAGISVTSGDAAPSKGLVYAILGQYEGQTASKLYINDVEVGYTFNSDGGYVVATAYAQVNKNDVITYTGNTGLISATFFPLKGVN